MLSEDEIAAFCVMLHYEAQLPLHRLKMCISPLAQGVTVFSVWFFTFIFGWALPVLLCGHQVNLKAVVWGRLTLFYMNHLTDCLYS